MRALLIAAVLLASTSAEARPRCRYPQEMYRPSMGICVLKSRSAFPVKQVKPVKRHKPRAIPDPEPVEIMQAEPEAVPLPREKPKPSLIDQRWPL